LVEEQGSGDAEVEPHESFGTQAIRQDLGGVGGHDTGLDVVEDAIEKDGDDEASSEAVCGGYIISSRDDGEDVEDNEGAYGRDEIDGPTTKLVDEESKEKVFAKRQGLHTTIDAELCLGISHAYIIHDIFQIVGNQTVTRPLREEANSSNDANPLSVTRSLEKVRPSGFATFFVERDGRFDFSIFELDELVIFVSLAMPAGEYVEGFLVAVLVAEPWK
jgi:hypothetical protein